MLQRSWSQPNPHRLWEPFQIFTLAMAAMCIQCARFWTPDAWDGRRWSTSGSGIGFTGTCSAKLVGGCNPAYPDCAMFQWHFHMLRHVSSQCALHARVSVMFSCRFIFDLFWEWIRYNHTQSHQTSSNALSHHVHTPVLVSQSTGEPCPFTGFGQATCGTQLIQAKGWRTQHPSRASNFVSENNKRCECPVPRPKTWNWQVAWSEQAIIFDDQMPNHVRVHTWIRIYIMYI